MIILPSNKHVGVYIKGYKYKVVITTSQSPRTYTIKNGGEGGFKKKQVVQKRTLTDRFITVRYCRSGLCSSPVKRPGRIAWTRGRVAHQYRVGNLNGCIAVGYTLGLQGRMETTLPLHVLELPRFLAMFVALRALA